MMRLPIVNSEGKEVETFELDEKLLGGKVRVALLREAVLGYEANQRLGTVSVKGRGEVAGSTRKLFRQKGTGRARAGSRRAPQRVGGGKAHGPKPRDFRKHMPKAARQAALRSAILSRLRDGEAVVVDKIELAEAKTKLMAKLLAQLGVEGTCLIATEGYDAVMLKAARNIPGISVMPVKELSAHEVLRPKHVVFTKGSLAKLLEGKSK